MDDRYRLYEVSAVSEALWQESMSHGVKLATDEQVAVARTLASRTKTRSGPLRATDVTEAFSRFELGRVPSGYARAVIARLERLSR